MVQSVVLSDPGPDLVSEPECSSLGILLVLGHRMSYTILKKSPPEI